MSLGHGACAFFFFNDTATTEIYTLSLHDALPISGDRPAEPALAVSDKAVHRDAHRVDQHGFKRAAPQRRAMHSASSPMHGADLPQALRTVTTNAARDRVQRPRLIRPLLPA